MSEKSFVSKLVSKGALPIYFITCKDAQGKECYAFLISTKEKIRMYENKRSEGEFNLHDYGQVIASGYGLIPSPKVRKMLKDEYDLDSSVD
jgi:hypothetical protein